MPREFLKPNQQRESRGEAKLFPRTERHIEAPACDRMVRRDQVEDRRMTKQTLRELAASADAGVKHVID
jgi:hypothetical protein